MDKHLKRLIEKIFRRFNLILSGGKILKTDGNNAQISFYPGELKDKVPIASHYGFHSVPPEDSRCLVVSTGERDQSAVIASRDPKHKDRDKTQGVVEIYNKDRASVTLKGREVTVNADIFAVGNGATDLIGLLSDFMDLMQGKTPIVIPNTGVLEAAVQMKAAEIKTKFDEYRKK